MKQTLPEIIVITGPTASGKTELSVELAKKIGAEIICADSRIVFKDLDIVSAKPDEIEKDGVIHHLIDIRTPDDGLYSAGDFVHDAEKIIENSKKPIIIQGGTWFYIKSLLDEKSLIGIGQNAELRKKLEPLSDEEIYEILKAKDKERADLIHKNNRDKVIRSIELIEALGEKLSAHERKENKNYNARWFMKEIEREKLYERINLRVDKMIEAGLYSEWDKNRKKYKNKDILYSTIGYREFFDFEDKLYADFDEAVSKIKQHTRNFAKRQLTFFNQNMEKYDIKTVSGTDEIEKHLMK